MNIRPILLSDLNTFFDLVERNRTYLSAFFPKTVETVQDPESCAEFILDKILRYDRRESYLLVIEKEGQLIGMVSLKEVNWKESKSEIAYFVDEACQGQGIMTQALDWLKSFSFEELGLDKIYARISPGNPASKRVVEKNGFKFEGLICKDFRNGKGDLVDVEYFALVRDKSPFHIHHS